MLIKKLSLNTIIFILAIIAVIEVIGLFCSTSPSPQQHNQNKTSKENYASGTTIFSPVISNTTQGLDCIIDWVGTNSDAVVALATIAIALFTWTLWRATTGMLGVAQEQSKDMKDFIGIAQDAAIAAKKSADAAEKSVYAARETVNVMRAQDRAYIFVNIEFDKFQKTSTDIKKIIDEGLQGDYKAVIKIVNHGKTPAIVKSFHYKIDFFTTNEVIDFFTNYWSIKSVIPNEGEIIEGSKDIPFLFSFYVDPLEQHYFLDSDNPDLLCVGRVEYEDVFNNIHETIFCWEFRYLIVDFHICEKYRYNHRT